MRQIKFSTFFLGFLLVTFSVAWILFLPIQFGGAAAYVIIDGNSMEPVYQTGDLVIVRREASYSVGDIVTYYNLDLKQNVIHRIVGIEADHYIFQGDHNAWLDDDQPTFDRLIGKAWLHLPGVGRWLSKLQTPVGITVLAVLALLIVLSLFFTNDRQMRARRAKMLSGSRLVSFSFDFPQGDAAMRKMGRQLEKLIFVFVVFLGVSLFLGLTAFTRPETLEGSSVVEYVQIGRFSYQAQAAPGVYDTSGPQTGDPVFLKAACQVDLNFVYSLAGQTFSGLEGEVALRAEIHDLNGWVRSYPLAPVTRFSTATATVQATLDPCQIISNLREIEALTGVSRPFYTLLIVPEVKFSGEALGRPITDAFAPELQFYLDDYQMYPVSEFPEVDAFAPYQVGQMSFSNRQANQIQLPFFALEVSLARWLALAGLLLSLGLGALLVFLTLRELQTDPSIGISLRYGTLIVDVTQVSFDLRAKEIMVASFEDIVKLAERNSTAILHLRRLNEHEFLVEGNSVVYRYRVPHRR